MAESLKWRDDRAEANGWTYWLNSWTEVRGTGKDWWVLVREPGSERFVDGVYTDPPLRNVDNLPYGEQRSKSRAKRVAQLHADEVAGLIDP